MKQKTIYCMNTNSTTESFISLKNVVKTYTTPADSFEALKGVNVQIRRGEFFAEFIAVVGKSGSGKSTLLNMLTGIDIGLHPAR